MHSSLGIARGSAVAPQGGRAWTAGARCCTLWANMCVKLEITEIAEDGEIMVDMDGFKGKGCAAIVDVIERALGPSRRMNKPEYDAKGRVRDGARVRTKV